MMHGGVGESAAYTSRWSALSRVSARGDGGRPRNGAKPLGAGGWSPACCYPPRRPKCLLEASVAGGVQPKSNSGSPAMTDPTRPGSAYHGAVIRSVLLGAFALLASGCFIGAVDYGG